MDRSGMRRGIAQQGLKDRSGLIPPHPAPVQSASSGAARGEYLKFDETSGSQSLIQQAAKTLPPCCSPPAPRALRVLRASELRFTHLCCLSWSRFPSAPSRARSDRSQRWAKAMFQASPARCDDPDLNVLAGAVIGHAPTAT